MKVRRYALIAIVAVLLYLFKEIALKVGGQEPIFFDTLVRNWLFGFASPALDKMFTLITEMGSTWWLQTFTVLIALWLLFRKRKLDLALFFLLVNVLGALLNKFLKGIYERERPSINPDVDGVGFSFPSGHSTGSMVFYGSIVYLFLRSRSEKPVKLMAVMICILLILLIGASRIYLNVHYPTDVAGGFIVGLVWLLISIFLLELPILLKERKENNSK